MHSDKTFFIHNVAFNTVESQRCRFSPMHQMPDTCEHCRFSHVWVKPIRNICAMDACDMLKSTRRVYVFRVWGGFSCQRRLVVNLSLGNRRWDYLNFLPSAPCIFFCLSQCRVSCIQSTLRQAAGTRVAAKDGAGFIGDTELCVSRL